jgi:glycosyltransferase involved in cell wall biosynthesis
MMQREQLQDWQSVEQAELARIPTELDQTQTAIERLQLKLYQAQLELKQAKERVIAMETSKFWKLRRLWFRFKALFGMYEPQTLIDPCLLAITETTQKQNPVPFMTARYIDVPISRDSCYQNWLNRHYPRIADFQRMAESSKVLRDRPLISVVMPVFNPPESYLRAAVESVREQVYPDWELCIADDASTKPYVRSLLQEYAEKDDRIKVVYRPENGHISRASNSALELATGEFIALLDHDDLLTPDALYEVALCLNLHPEADMIYSDEDKVDEQNFLREPFFKPDWCPDSFLSRMYTCHLGVYRRQIVEEIGGFRIGYEGSQDYDLALRFTETTKNIFHIPKVLYHWRHHSDSTASKLSNKSYATSAAMRALSEALERRGDQGKVLPTKGGHHLIRYEIREKKLVSVIIPTRDLGNVLDTCLRSIFTKTQYPNYEVLLIDNGSREPRTLEVIQSWLEQEPQRFRCEPLDIPFNYSTINNYAVKKAKGDYLLFLNNDTEVITPDWIDAMVEQAQRPSIGAVGALLLYDDNTIQHAGVICVGGVAGHGHRFFDAEDFGYFCQVPTINNYAAVTAACMMCRREAFEAVGGFEEDLAVAFNDIDFCFKLLEAGYRNIYLPHVRLYHYESKSRGYETTPEKIKRFEQEILYMKQKWSSLIEQDPHYSPHLTRAAEDYSIAI